MELGREIHGQNGFFGTTNWSNSLNKSVICKVFLEVPAACLYVS